MGTEPDELDARFQKAGKPRKQSALGNPNIPVIKIPLFNAGSPPTDKSGGYVILPPPELKQEPALRFDAGKPRYELIPADALEELAKVYAAGALKYGDDNWLKGMSWGRCFGSLMRHAWKFWRGLDIDEETGCHHMMLAAWNCIALFVYARRKLGTDSRITLPTGD